MSYLVYLMEQGRNAKLLSNAIDLGKHMDESFDPLGPWYKLPTSQLP